MDFISAIDKSICNLDLDARVAEANQLDQKNRKDLLNNSTTELKKIKETSDNTTIEAYKTEDKLNDVEVDATAVWMKACEYIDHAEQFYPKFMEIPRGMIQIIKKRANI
ncbi:hypothetical protein BmR1_04g05505 [Babesia microti strain RI]|uniref:Uncharacterized protein n=1 Tax=Babesia microti (strain RI) TaxID=1133968 RepID=I7I9M5_BABMR|nr:hypothetical protein BmR1_04g05505 [Babesia microti strain RI]CCF75299.1 hypothetical protein BmR1_04g05505 [Babesia microti strain RI]|eukprot:XP_012649707.1 hypothetical protein BmR1_04g05505 [Babesia microti strain RI]